MNIDSAFPSKYLKASDLNGKTARVTIRAVTMEDVGRDDRKPVLYFQGKEKGLVLNRTNSQAIATLFGQETDNWAGGDLELFTVMTDYQGQAREAIRVRIAPRKPAAATATAAAPRAAAPVLGPFDDVVGDEIPF